MENNILTKKCKGFTQKGIPCRYKPVMGSDYCTLHQPKSEVEAQTYVATPVKEPAPIYSGVEKTSSKVTDRKTKDSNTLNRVITCIFAVIILLFSCCCGLIIGTGSTAWLYEAIEGPCYTQVLVTKFAVTQVILTQIAGTPAPTYTYYPIYTLLPTLTLPPTQEPLPPTETPEPTYIKDTTNVSATPTIGQQENLIVDALEIIDSPIQKVEGLVGTPLEIYTIGTIEADELPNGGEGRTYKVGKYTIEITFDKTDVAKGLQILEGLTEDGYSLEQWPIILKRIGVETAGSPDIEAPAARRWINTSGYAIMMALEKTGGVVWTVRIYKIPPESIPTENTYNDNLSLIPILGNIYSGVKVYYANEYIFEILGGSENCPTFPSGRGIKVIYPSGSIEWKDRNYIVQSGLFFVLENDPAISALQWYEYNDCP